MSFPAQSPGLLGRITQRVDESVRLLNRSHQYTPASKFRTLLYLVFIVGHAIAVAQFIVWVYVTGLIGLLYGSVFLIIAVVVLWVGIFPKAYVDSEIAAGNFVVLGRRGIAHVRDFNFFGPEVEEDSWPDRDPKGGLIMRVRWVAWLWLRKNGIANVPKSYGGGLGGYITVAAKSWTRDFPLRAQIQIPDDVARELQQLEGKIPGMHQDTVVNLRYHFEAGTAEELSDHIRNAIKNDDTYVDNAPVEIGYDPLPDAESVGAVYPPNAIARLWALEYLVKQHQIGAIDQSMEIAAMAQAGRQANATTVIVQSREQQQPPS